MLPFPAVVPMDVAQQASVQVHGEERLRAGSDIDALESEVSPLARYDLIWDGGQNHAVALYNPRFIHTRYWDRQLPGPDVVNPESINTEDPNNTPLSALHNGGAGIEMIRRRWRLSLYQFAAYGPITTTALLVHAPWTGDVPPPDPLPIVPSTISARFTLLFLQTQLFVPYRISPRVAIIPGFAYNAFGGANQESRGVIALSQFPYVSLSLDVAATRDDRLVSNIGSAVVSNTFQDERDNVTIYRAEASQSWRHWFSPRLSSELLGGGSLGGDQINGFSIYSLASAALLYDSYPVPRIPPGAPPAGGGEGRGPHVQLGATAKIAPWVDIFSGDLEQRVVGSVAANYIVGRTTFRGQLSAARVINTPRSIATYQIIFSDVGIRYQLMPIFSVDGGLRFGYQEFDNAVRADQLSQIQGYVGLTFAPLAHRF
jgi:hypothetical protein